MYPEELSKVMKKRVWLKPQGKNKYGYLLYNQKAQERIERIKLFQDLGFSIKEICILIDAPKEILKLRLEEQVQVITVELEQKKWALKRAKDLIAETDK